MCYNEENLDEAISLAASRIPRLCLFQGALSCFRFLRGIQRILFHKDGSNFADDALLIAGGAVFVWIVRKDIPNETSAAGDFLHPAVSKVFDAAGCFCQRSLTLLDVFTNVRALVMRRKAR